MKRFNSLCIKLSVVAMMLFLGVEAFAQKDVTTFLGIPVDGTREEMIRKLKEKGFTTDVEFSEQLGYEILEGEFNGTDVNIGIATNNNKVWRIMVAEKHKCDEAQIKIRFNSLYDQFSKNPRYSEALNEKIPKDEDISYEMTVNNKEYKAAFIQMPTITNELYTQAFDQLNIPDSLRSQALYEFLAEQEMKKYEKYYYKFVWFNINESESTTSKNKYSLTIYYENLYNEANGEDL